MEHMAISEIDTLAQARHNTHVLPHPPTHPPRTQTCILDNHLFLPLSLSESLSGSLPPSLSPSVCRSLAQSTETSISASEVGMGVPSVSGKRVMASPAKASARAKSTCPPPDLGTKGASIPPSLAAAGDVPSQHAARLTQRKPEWKCEKKWGGKGGEARIRTEREQSHGG